MQTKAQYRTWLGSAVVHLALAVPCVTCAYATAQDQPAGAEAARRHAPRHAAGASLDDRVKMLSKALALDAKQQAELRRVLERQREEVMKVWNDASLPAPYRVSATQAISDRTADQIRALLNEEQRKKYNPPKQPHVAAEGLGRRSVEDWMYPAKAPQGEK